MSLMERKTWKRASDRYKIAQPQELISNVEVRVLYNEYACKYSHLSVVNKKKGKKLT